VLWVIALALALLWAIGLALGAGGAIHVLLGGAVLLALARLLDYRRRELGY
jgi:hypothetical protein